MTKLERLTERYWRSCAVLRRRPVTDSMPDYEAWGNIAGLAADKDHGRLAEMASKFLFPGRHLQQNQHQQG